MPHVVLVGSIDLNAVFNALERISEREGATVLKTGAAYIEKSGGSLIVEATAIDAGKPVNFLVLISKRDDGLVVRLHPSLDVEKTDGVKKILALIAKRIMVLAPGSAVGKTNLQDFLGGA